MSPSEQNAVLAQAGDLLTALIDPVTEKPYWAANQVAGALALTDSGLSVRVTVGYPVALAATSIEAQIRAALAGLGVPVTVAVLGQIDAHVVQRNMPLLKGVKNLIAVASGKGGVGKSSTAVNLALALSRHGARVGLLDADIYGPSIPQMLGIGGQQPHSPDGKHIEALQAHGIALMSIGFLVDAESPMVWRGPMVTSALEQLLRDTLWGELDYLVVDMPPGTGDIQLTLAQQVPTTAAVIVTTPQDVALADARKGIAMFNKVNVPVLGIVENMSYHVCSACGHHEPLFGTGGGQKMAEQYHVALLGQLPLHIDIRQHMDDGCPTVFGAPDGELSQTYLKLARRVGAELYFSAKPIATPLYTVALDE